MKTLKYEEENGNGPADIETARKLPATAGPHPAASDDASSTIS